MAFKKGQSGNSDGRPPGAKDKKNTELRERVISILDKNFTDEAIATDLKSLKSIERLNILLKLLEFALPKLRTMELLTDFDRLSDEDLDRIIDELKKSNDE